MTGARGSGRTTLVRGALAQLAADRLVLMLDLDDRSDVRPLLARLCAAARVSEPGADAMGTLLQRLDEERQRQHPTPLVVLDGSPEDPAASAGISRLMSAAGATRMFRLLVTGPPTLVAARRSADPRGPRDADVTLPALDADQVAQYVRARVHASLASGAAPLLFTPDALRLLAGRARGSLRRIDLLAENMLALASTGRRRALTSWHALTASDLERWAETGPPAGSTEPPDWPTPEALQAIDLARQGAGLPPWPRAAGRGAR